MLTVEHLARGDNLRPISADRKKFAEAALTFTGWVAAGIAVEKTPPARKEDDAKDRR